MSPLGFARSSTDPGDDPYASRRERMVRRQLRPRGIEDERVLAAMARVPREAFLPTEERPRAYRDGALPIGGGQTMSQPWIVAYMTSLLELKGPERVLEVGTGSGYGAAVLAECCAEVVTVERDPELADRATDVLTDAGYARVEVRCADGSRGAPDRAPFDGISVTAAARGRAPAALLDQLRPGGALVCPVRDAAGDERILRHRDGRVQTGAGVRFVPLVEDA
jgi:protein-L-isoaspartate(D-aspartate) O-methyltransferase